MFNRAWKVVLMPTDSLCGDSQQCALTTKFTQVIIRTKTHKSGFAYWKYINCFSLIDMNIKNGSRVTKWRFAAQIEAIFKQRTKSYLALQCDILYVSFAPTHADSWRRRCCCGSLDRRIRAECGCCRGCRWKFRISLSGFADDRIWNKNIKMFSFLIFSLISQSATCLLFFIIIFLHTKMGKNKKYRQAL